MTLRRTLSGIILLLATLPAVAQQVPESIEADVSTRSVSITSSFVGTEIIVFGTVENSRQPSAEAGTYDVVVVVEGTPAPIVVRRKSRVAGLWMNTKQVRFASFPSYYAIASTRPIEDFAEGTVLKDNQIGLDHVRIMPAGTGRMTPAEPDEINEFRAAVVRLKQRERLYLTSEFGVTFIGRSLFRATLTLPPNIPVGPLQARVYLIKDGKVLSQYASTVMLEREGIERYLHDRANKKPVLYGVLTVLMAASAGIAAALIFRRIA